MYILFYTDILLDYTPKTNMSPKRQLYISLRNTSSNSSISTCHVSFQEGTLIKSSVFFAKRAGQLSAKQKNSQLVHLLGSAHGFASKSVWSWRCIMVLQSWIKGSFCCTKMFLKRWEFLLGMVYEKSSLITQMPCMWHICPKLNFKANGM